MVTNQKQLVPIPQPFTVPPVEPPIFSAQPEGDDPSRLTLSHYFWVVRRHKHQILAFVIFCMAVTLLVSFRIVPVYESTTTIDIDHESPSGIIGEEANRATLNDADQFLATQIKLIQSDSVLRPVAERFGLLEIERGLQPGASDIWARYGDGPIKLKRLNVTRPPNTSLLLISYRATDRLLAAEIANGIAQSYIAHTFDLRYKASASLAVFMEKQLDELRAKMERSTSALAQFERELNVIDPEEKTSIISSRLLQLNTEYTNSQAERVKKEVESRAIAGGSLEAALASSQGESLRKLLDHLNEVEEKFSSVRSQYGTSHPEYRRALGQVEELKEQIESMRLNIAARVRSEFAQAVNREKMLLQTVASTKSEFDRLNGRSFEYQQLKREADGDKKLYDELVRRIKEATINANFQNSTIRLADSARPALKPIFPKPGLNVLLAFFCSVILGIGAALLNDAFDNTVRDPEDMARAFQTHVLGTLPLVKSWRKRIEAPGGRSSLSPDTAKGLTQDTAMIGFGESVRSLRNAILLADFDRRLRTILVTSSSPAEGKSVTAVYLAMAHAEQGKKTLLIDCDLRRPSIHRKFGITATVGLSNVLLKEAHWQDVLAKPANGMDLDVLPAGPPSRRASGLVGSGIGDLLEEVSHQYDLVIIDAPPLLGFAEALQIATVVDGVIVVARAGETNRRAIASVLSSLKRLRVTVLGLVLNQVQKDSSNGYYYYHGYYGSYYGADERAVEVA